jgi:hypothetical protein
MPTIGQLRKSAEGLGIPRSLLRGATSADLQEMIDKMSGNGASTKPARKPATKAAPARRGRPKSTTKPTPVKSKPAAPKSTTGKAKRSTAVTDDGDAGRRMLSGVDYTETDGWNAREGSPPDLIVKSLRKFKGNRTKVFEALKANVWDYVGRKMADGSKRSLASAHTMLKYRISRTAWDFAMRTGQHEKSENRAEYGSGTGRKPAKKATATRTAAKTTRKPVGRPRTAAKRTTKPATTRKPVRAQKAAQRTTAKRPVAKKKTTRR